MHPSLHVHAPFSHSTRALKWGGNSLEHVSADGGHETRIHIARAAVSLPVSFFCCTAFYLHRPTKRTARKGAEHLSAQYRIQRTIQLFSVSQKGPEIEAACRGPRRLETPRRSGRLLVSGAEQGTGLRARAMQHSAPFHIASSQYYYSWTRTCCGSASLRGLLARGRRSQALGIKVAVGQIRRVWQTAVSAKRSRRTCGRPRAAATGATAALEAWLPEHLVGQLHEGFLSQPSRGRTREVQETHELRQAHQ